MLTLLIVGPAVEVMLGKIRFLVLYLLAGLGGNVLAYLIVPGNQVGAGASGAIFGVLGAYVVLARLRQKPMGPVLALIVINLVIGFTGNIEWQAHVGGLLIGAALAFAFQYASTLRDRTQEIAVTVGASILTLALLVLLLGSIAPGHVNVT